MKPIVLDGPDYGSVEIRMIDGDLPYLGVEFHDPRLMGSPQWHYIPEGDLWRLRKAIDRCLKKKKANK